MEGINCEKIFGFDLGRDSYENILRQGTT